MKDKVTVPGLTQLKKQGQKIVALTCYDFTTATLLNESGTDLLLVGDSLGMVKLGLSSTVPVTIEDMVYHTRLVARANTCALVVADMPYGSYHADVKDAVRHATLLLKAGAEAVKIEGGKEMLPVFKALQAAKVPVVAHLGMTPQSVNVFGGYRVQGKDRAARAQLVSDVRAIEKAGACAVVLECIPLDLAKKITRTLSIPTIGIGAGPHCDGQVLVIDDLLGLTPPPHPRFVKAYSDLRRTISDAARAYARDVRGGRFPDDEHSYH